MGTNTTDTRVMDAVRHLVRALSASARAVESSTGISGAQLFLLRQLADAGTPLSVNELAERTRTHQSTVSGVLARLVRRRLVTRTPAPDDARRMSIALTHRGRALASEAPPTAQTQIVRGLAAIAPAQRARLADTLEAWLAASGLGGEAAPLFFERERAPKHRPARGARSASRA
jgi:DNA-binding MarR family transcriptional regulator